MDLFNLNNQTAFVTGAGSGIGQAIAIGLAQAGANVGCFDLNRSGLTETQKKIEALGKKGWVYEGDVCADHDLKKAIDDCSKQGQITIAVNSAGVANAAPAKEMDIKQWQKMLDINLTGIFRSCQEECAVMLPFKQGAIINIASMSGIIVNRGLSQAHYNTSKAGVIHLTKSLAMEWVDHGIRVNSISPGYTFSPMNKRPEVAQQVKIFEESTPIKRMAEVEEMVGPAIFLASKASSYCTGIDLLVDGGFTCW